MTLTSKSLGFLLIVGAGLVGCSTQIGGDGQLSTGEPLSVMMDARIVSATESYSIVDITSLDGWSCRATVKDGEQTGIRQSHPLTCSNGATGTLILTWDQIQLRQNGAFKLNNGRSGRIVFDFKR